MEHIIWSNENLDYKDFREFIEENYPDATESEGEQLMYELNAEYLSDEIANLRNLVTSQDIIAIGSVGRWDGCFPALGQLHTTQIAACLQNMFASCEYFTFYVKDGDLYYRGRHHDGTNLFRFRAWSDNATDEDRANFAEHVIDGVLTEEEIQKFTTGFGDKIAAVYGW